MKLTSFFYLLYILFIPLEPLIVFDGFGSFSRLIGYLLVFSFFIERRRVYSIMPKEGYVFLLFLLLSFLWGDIRDVEQGLRIVMFFIFSLIVSNIVVFNPRVFWKSMDLFSIVVGFLAVRTFIGFLTTQDRFDASDLGLASVALLFVVSTGIQLLQLRMNGFKTFRLILIVLNFFGIIATGTRAAWLAVIVLLLIYFYENARARHLFAGLFLFFIGYILVSMFFTDAILFIESRVTRVASDKGANRLSIWKVAFEMWKDRPLFGFGYRNFPNNFTFEYIDRTELTEIDYNNLTFGGTSGGRGSHSDYVSTIVELGLFGFFLAVSWMKKLFAYFEENRILYLPLIGILTMSFFQDNINQKVFWWMLGMAACIPQLDKLVKE